MSRESEQYWQEAFECALDELGLYPLIEGMTAEQRTEMGKALAMSHECYGQAFYSPPPSDRIHQIERDHKAQLAEVEARFDRYRETAENVLVRVLRQPHGTRVGINSDGEVHRYGGRIERIA